MFLAHDFLQAVFAVFNKHKTIAHAVASSEVSVSIAIDETEHLNEIVEELRQFSDVEISSNKAIVCIVGENIKHNVGFIGQVFSALSGIHINMISHGASEINLSFVVDEDSLNSAVRLLHQQLFGNVSQQSDIFD
jgi:Aspartokinases